MRCAAPQNPVGRICACPLRALRRGALPARNGQNRCLARARIDECDSVDHRQEFSDCRTSDQRHEQPGHAARRHWSALAGKMYLVAAVIFRSTVPFPAIELGALIYVLAPLAIGRRAPGVKAVIRLIQAAQPWGMIEVFMLGTLITLVKLSRAADLTLGPALFAFIALSILLACLSAFEPRHLWHSAASDGSSFPRKTNSIGRTWALLLAAAILYIPANLLPVMHTRSLLGVQDDTIISGIVFFWNSGSWAIAIIIFVASVVVPLLKLAALALLAFTAQRGMRGGQRARARLYRLIERIGR